MARIANVTDHPARFESFPIKIFEKRMRLDVNSTTAKASNAFRRGSLEELRNQMASESGYVGRISNFATQRLLVNRHPVFRVERRNTNQKLVPEHYSEHDQTTAVDKRG